MRCPVVSENLQSTFGQRDESVLGSFATMDVNHHPFGIEVADLQIESFFQPEPQRIGGPEEGSVVMLPSGSDNCVDFIDGQYIGQRFLFWNAKFLQHIPITRTGDAKEELESVVGDFERSGAYLRSLIRCSR